MGDSGARLADRLQALLGVALGAGGSLDAAPELDALLQARLDDQRLSPLLGYALRGKDAAAALSPDLQRHLRLAYQATLLHNQRQLQCLQRLVAALGEVGVQPVLLKGMHLALELYPDFGCRPMQDLDLLVEADQRERSLQVVRELGFVIKRQDPGQPSGERADGLVDAEGLQLDLHYVFGLFNAAQRDGLRAELALPDGQRLGCFSGEGLAAHLAHHLWGHRRRDGDLLFWLLDLYFLWEREGANLDPARIEVLIPDPRIAQHLWRCLHLMAEIAGRELDLPALQLPPYRLEELLALRELRAWRLPGKRALLRLWAVRLGLKQAKHGRWLPDPCELRLARQLLRREVAEFRGAGAARR